MSNGFEMMNGDSSKLLSMNTIRHIVRISFPQWLIRLAFLNLIFTLHAWAANEITGKIISVLDGDTVTVLDSSNTQHRIRLAQIDAPEKRQAFGDRSKESLASLAFGKTCAINVETKDRYGREVAQIVCSGIDVNLEQVRRGMAWAYRKYSHDLEYITTEDRAKANGVGLWHDKDPTPPWEFRRQ